jgi:hypothetical protein
VAVAAAAGYAAAAVVGPAADARPHRVDAYRSAGCLCPCRATGAAVQGARLAAAAAATPAASSSQCRVNTHVGSSMYCSSGGNC